MYQSKIKELQVELNQSKDEISKLVRINKKNFFFFFYIYIFLNFFFLFIHLF